MSTMVLNLPMNYVDVERDEMELDKIKNLIY